MNLLHLCHWQSISHFKQHSPLLKKQHALVIYGEINLDDLNWLIEYMQHAKLQWHLVNDNPNPNNGFEIDSVQWLQLIIESDKTLTWK